MSDISYYELIEKLAMDEPTLQKALDLLLERKIFEAEKSKHKVLGTTYKVNDMYHSGLCILFASMESTREGLNGISCCMGYGDYPINI